MFNISHISVDSSFHNLSILTTSTTASSQPIGRYGARSAHRTAASKTKALRVHDRSMSQVP